MRFCTRADLLPTILKTQEIRKQATHNGKFISAHKPRQFLIRNPQYKFNPDYAEPLLKFIEEHKKGKSLQETGSWFYFPWNKTLIHYLPDALHQEIRTARNKNIITEEEQKKFYNFRVGIAGLSVGSHGALTLVMMGGARRIKLADPDEISGSNLNRIRYDYTKINENKTSVAAHIIYQMNPYAEIDIYDKGITAENVNEFLSDLDVLVEEMDNLELKILVRLKARELGIPVIMATDNGDNVIMDIERYDFEPNLEIFNGAAGHLTLEEFKKITPQDMPKLATKIAGPKVVVPRMLTSLLEVGKTLYSWPQLGDAATLSGVAIAYTVKRIALGEKVKTGKFEINLDAIFDPEYNNPVEVGRREEIRTNFMNVIGLAGDASMGGNVGGTMIEETIKEIVRQAIWAPSGDNSQPWRFVISDNTLKIFNLPHRDNPILNYKQSGSYVAHGALIENIVIISSQSGFKVVVALFPDSINKDLVAVVTFEMGKKKNEPLYPFIKARHTNRKPYKDIPLTFEQKNVFLKIKEKEGRALIVDEKEKIQAIAKAASVMERVALETPAIHKLFFESILWKKEENDGGGKGLYIKSLELPVPAQNLFKIIKNWKVMNVLNKIGLSKKAAQGNAEVYAQSAAMGVIVIDEDKPEDFILAGRLMQRVWLEATRIGLSVQPLAGLTFIAQKVLKDDTEGLRATHFAIIKNACKDINRAYSLEKGMAVMVFRLGYSDPATAHSSRMEPQIEIL